MTNNNKESRIRNAISSTGSSISSNLEFKYDTEKIKKENRYRVQGQAFPKNINCFNWGACILTPIWGLCNNTPIALLSLVTGFIPYIGIIIGIAFSLYCGIKGNEWAWANKEWDNLNHFHYVQRQWAKWAIILEILMFCIILAGGLHLIKYFDQILNMI